MGNYQDSKRRFQKGNNNDRPSSIKVNVPLFYIENVGSFTPNGTQFDIDSLDSILLALNDANAFRMISHPVTMKKSDVFADAENAKGNITVGYIRNITNGGDIALTINAKYVDAFKKIKEPTIQVNGIVKDGAINTILGFIIGEYGLLEKQYTESVDDTTENYVEE